jgi:predicted aconitase with swiveling domain
MISKELLSIHSTTLLVNAAAEGKVMYCEEGLSFWCGVDPDTGVIIDAHHPNNGASLAGFLQWQRRFGRA